MTLDDSFDDLMQRLRVGDSEAARIVFDRFAQRLAGLARKHLDARLRPKLDPEDILQSVFESFFRRQAAGEIAPEGWESLWSLLTVITLRKCGHQVRYFHALCRDASRETPSLDEDSLLGCQTIARDPTPVEAAVLAETVTQLMSWLTTRDRPIVTLALQGRTAAEIGCAVDRPRRAVYRVLERVKNHLQAMQAED
ncbi:MAG TPA: sigma-70 family RNA polymerase sigma factor [Gemmataceae bacterium]